MDYYNLVSKEIRYLYLWFQNKTNMALNIFWFLNYIYSFLHQLFKIESTAFPITCNSDPKVIKFSGLNKNFLRSQRECDFKTTLK